MDMASIRKKTTRKGIVYYEIRVSRGRNKPVLSKRWDPPKGWSKKAIEKELNKVVFDFECQVKDGAILSKAEAAKENEKLQIEEAKIPTLKQYVENNYMPALSIRCCPVWVNVWVKFDFRQNAKKEQPRKT